MVRCKEFCLSVGKIREQFVSKSAYEQIKILYEIIKFLQCKAVRSDLSSVGIKHNGALYFNKDITNANVVLINSSPCGLHVTKRKL